MLRTARSLLKILRARAARTTYAAEHERQPERNHRDDFQEACDGELFEPHDGRQQRQEKDRRLRIRKRERQTAEEQLERLLPRVDRPCLDGLASSVTFAGGAVQRRYARYSRYSAPAYLMTTNTSRAVCASAARPVAATANQIRSPIRNPAMKAIAPCVPRASERAMTAATPGPGVATASRYTEEKINRP